MQQKIKNAVRTRAPWAVDLFHRIQGAYASYRWRQPSAKLKIIAVTGTNGKTTTVAMIATILEEAGYKVGLLTSYEFQIGQKRARNDTKMTTLPPGYLQKHLAQMVAAHCEYAILEVTSHALAQHRTWGITPRVGVLTNVTHDHLDFHKTFAQYRETKMLLFSQHPRTSVINLDDPSAPFFLKLPAFQHFTYSVEGRADVSARKILSEAHSTLFTAVTPMGQVVIDLKVPGRFNVANALAAMATGIAEGVSLDIQKKALEKFAGVPGRMEQIHEGQKFQVLVDFAHTPDALQKIYETIKPTVRGKLITVLGATGRRDVSKRPIMGALAGRWADMVVVTDEDPYDEDPLAIMQAVAKGVPRGGPKQQKPQEGKDYFIIPDRAEAIKFALEHARPPDTVLITGKGGERWMMTRQGKIPWSDDEIIRKLLRRHPNDA